MFAVEFLGSAITADAIMASVRYLVRKVPSNSSKVIDGVNEPLTTGQPPISVIKSLTGATPRTSILTRREVTLIGSYGTKG